MPHRLTESDLCDRELGNEGNKQEKKRTYQTRRAKWGISWQFRRWLRRILFFLGEFCDVTKVAMIIRKI